VSANLVIHRVVEDATLAPFFIPLLAIAALYVLIVLEACAAIGFRHGLPVRRAARWGCARATRAVKPICRSNSRSTNAPPLEEIDPPERFTRTRRLRQFENENVSWLHSVTVWLPVGSSPSN